MDGSKPTATPVSTNTQLEAKDGTGYDDATQYIQLVGAL